ncbi:MAG: PrsW family intramembrane metalloprotease [Candidatus Heimdallarchaeota archaeon]|nr:PrsW family intramembrane metalloprotease [Candidatus Heimdallarchaeota archaeon]
MDPTLELILAILTIILPLLGGGFTAIMFYYRDIMEKEPKEQIVKALFWGILAGVLCISITVPMYFLAKKWLEQTIIIWKEIVLLLGFVIIQAIFEEVIKGLILWQAILKSSHEIDGLFDGFFYGAMIGTGAGVVDAIVYGILGGDWIEGLEIALIRTIRIPGTHALFTGIIGLFFAWRIFKEKNMLPGIIYALGLHLIWNIITFFIFRFFVGFYYYLANFIILVLYLLIMTLTSYFAVKYDQKNFPIDKREIVKKNEKKL